MRAAARASLRFFLPLSFRRGAAGLLALAVLASPVLDFAHSARVQHATCPEDGELVDVVPGAPELAHSDEGAVLPGRQEAASDHRHQHCLLAARGRQTRNVERRARPCVPAPVEVALRERPRSLALPAQIAIYRIAPKISPPLA